MPKRIDSQPTYLQASLKLAFPIMILQAGQMLVVIADNLMVGQLGATHLAAASFANNIFLVGMVFTIGLINALTMVAGKEIGGGERLRAVNWLRQSLTLHPLISIGQICIMAALGLLMPHMGQPAEVVELAIPYYMVLVVSLAPMQFFFIFKQYTEALGNTRIASVISIAANVVNVILNYLLIYGKLGFPSLGLMGAGYATLVVRTLMPIAFLVIFLTLDYFKPDRKLWKSTRFSLPVAMKLLRLGLPISGQYVVEVAAFSIGGIMMGWFGEKALAAHQVVMSLASLTFMVSGGIATATTIKVSHYRGGENFNSIKGFFRASLKMVTIFMASSVVLFLIFRYKIPAIFVNDPEVVTIAGGLMLIAGLFQVSDGLQVVTQGALHGLEDVKTPMMVIIITYITILLPTGYIAAFVLGMGPQGIWIGYLAGLIVVGILLLLRFRWKINRYISTNQVGTNQTGR